MGAASLPNDLPVVPDIWPRLASSFEKGILSGERPRGLTAAREVFSLFRHESVEVPMEAMDLASCALVANGDSSCARLMRTERVDSIVVLRHRDENGYPHGQRESQRFDWSSRPPPQGAQTILLPYAIDSQLLAEPVPHVAQGVRVVRHIASHRFPKGQGSDPVTPQRQRVGQCGQPLVLASHASRVPETIAFLEDLLEDHSNWHPRQLHDHELAYQRAAGEQVTDVLPTPNVSSSIDQPFGLLGLNDREWPV